MSLKAGEMELFTGMIRAIWRDYDYGRHFEVDGDTGYLSHVLRSKDQQAAVQVLACRGFAT
jgi:hypothetical protein